MMNYDDEIRQNKGCSVVGFNINLFTWTLLKIHFHCI